jgi:hypothetical protein
VADSSEVASPFSVVYEPLTGRLAAPRSRYPHGPETREHLELIFTAAINRRTMNITIYSSSIRYVADLRCIRRKQSSRE